MDGTTETVLAGLVSFQSDTNTGCCIKVCRNAAFRSNVVYFSFPQEPNRQSAWLKLLREYITENWDCSKLQICSDHFELGDIVYNNSQPDLIPSALPKVHRIPQRENVQEELIVKMECMSEAEEGLHGPVCSEPQNMDGKHMYGEEGRIIKSANTAVKSVKKENVVREIENNVGDGYSNGNETNNEGKSESCQSQASTSTNPTDGQLIFKRKRGRPRKGTFIPRMTPSRQTSSVNNDQESSTNILYESTSKTNRTSLLSYDSTEDPGDGETDTEVKPKRKRRSKILDDFVADFNTSDEEEDSFLSSFPKFPSRGRGKGRGRRAEMSDPFDDDLFSSYIGVFGKKFSIEDDFPSDSLLGDINENDEDIFTPSDLNTSTVKTPSDSKDDSVGSDGLEGVLGPDGNTKVQIINTGQIESVDNEEYVLYHVITYTESTKTITPLRIPNVKNDLQSEAEMHSQPSPSYTRQDENKQEKESSKADMSSLLRKKKQKQVISQQVTSLRQRYCRALQELRKRPRVYTLADLVYGASGFLSEDQLIFFTLQLKSGCNNMQGIRFSVREKMLALGFYLQSPSLYKWLRSVFHLPSKLILDRWLEGLAKTDPDAAKRLMYHVYTRYVFKS